MVISGATSLVLIITIISMILGFLIIFFDYQLQKDSNLYEFTSISWLGVCFVVLGLVVFVTLNFVSENVDHEIIEKKLTMY